MRSKRLLERAITLFVVFVVAFSAIASIPASAQVPPGDGGNPMVEDAAAVPAAAKMDLRDLRKIDPAQPVRLIVVLKDAPLAKYDGGVQGLPATSAQSTGARKLNVESSAARAYLAYLTGKQEQFKADLSAVVPDARYDRAYQVVLNGFGVKVMGADVAKILEMPEVAFVQTDNEYKLEMDASIPLIGLGDGTLGDPAWVDEGLWQAVGGHNNAGKGIKVADIDSGITPENPCFSGTGYAYPKGFPKGEKAITNKKIIAAYSYFRADDPPVYPESARDDPGTAEGGHGTHTAGTIACNYGTVSTFSNLKISGVAPKAQLMVYRVFYESITGSHSAYTVELVAAIEQAVKDGADVANNSWGGTALAMDEVETMAYQAAVDAGVIVVFSAGNSGPGAMTHGSPSIGEKFISVAASQTNRTFNTTLTVDSSTDPLAVLPAAMTGASVAQSPVTAEIIDLQAEGYGDTIACIGALPGSLVDGKIVVVRRGTCALVDKVSNAAAGGAVGVVIRNVAGGAATLPMIVPVLPTIHINAADGDVLYAFLSGLAVGTTATATIHAPAVLNLAGDTPDLLASFSSRGPAPDLTLKPDISAPGVNILSSVSPVDYGGTTNFEFYQGTSMAAPHVSGAAALLAQLKPTWTPQQVKSALMSTAAEPAALGTNPANRGAGRLALAEPHLVGATANPASVSLKLMTVADTKPVTIGLESTGAAVTYDVAIVQTTASIGFTGWPTSVTVPAGGFAQLEFTAEALSAGDGYGKIVLTPQGGGVELHFPYFGRVVAELGSGDEEVFLVDDDLSVDDPACTDVRPAYTDMLDDLGKTYVVWEVGEDNGYAIDFNQARKYDKVIYFTGVCDFNGDLSFLSTSMRNYLAQGGKMLITGQDIGYWDNFWLNAAGASFNPALFFGGRYIQDNIFPGDKPVPAVKGDSTYADYLDGQMYDIDHAANPWVDEIQAVMYSDVDTLPILHSAPVGSILRDGHLGTRMSDEMTIERKKGSEPYSRIGYRTQWVSFGLEAVTDNLNNGTELMDRLLAWLDDEVAVEFDAEHFYGKVGFATKLTASADYDYAGGTGTGYENSIQYYRWDFGDGSPVVATADALVSHKYAKLGDYKVMVEVMDGFGHKAIHEAMVHIIKPPANPKTMAPLNLKTATPTLRWGVVKGATNYQVEIWSVAGGQTARQAVVDTTACVKNTCSWVVTPALANGNYMFKVRAGIEGIWGNFSAYRSFKVAAP